MSIFPDTSDYFLETVFGSDAVGQSGSAPYRSHTQGTSPVC